MGRGTNDRLWDGWFVYIVVRNKACGVGGDMGCMWRIYVCVGAGVWVCECGYSATAIGH